MAVPAELFSAYVTVTSKPETALSVIPIAGLVTDSFPAVAASPANEAVGVASLS